MARRSYGQDPRLVGSNSSLHSQSPLRFIGHLASSNYKNLLLRFRQHKMQTCTGVQTLRLVSELRQDLERLLPRAECIDTRTKTLKHLFECSSCNGFMSQPVCLPCGHTACRSCLDRPSEQAGSVVTCPQCGEKHSKTPIGSSSPRKTTLLLQNLQQKWFPAVLDCCRHREEGNKFAQEGDFPMAIECYDKAVKTGVPDHRVFSNGSRAQFAVSNHGAALQNAEFCCCLKPFWPKGHYRRAVVLEKMGQAEAAASSYLLCLHLGGMEHPVARLLSEVIDALLRELPNRQTDNSEASESQAQTPQQLSADIVSVAITQLRHYQRLNQEIDESDVVDSSLVDISDFECVLCAGLLYDPVTVTCGHSFCLQCLNRTFDHSPFCPICRTPLGEMFSQHTNSAGQLPVDSTLISLIKHFFLCQYNEKSAQVIGDLIKRARVGLCDSEELPIFVCSLAFPGMPCPLHIFEPRYRLMMRRCVETNSRRFGMCLPLEDESATGVDYVDVGTILFISSLEYTPDGRSLVTTVAERRFLVTKRGSSDGYNTASIEFISDKPVEGQEEIAALRQLQTEVYDHSKRWLNALPIFTRLLVVQQVCSPTPPIEPHPETCPDGPTWLWWYVNAVPTTQARKLDFLRCTSLHDRLLMLRDALPVPTTDS